jgi:hypothetical protein
MTPASVSNQAPLAISFTPLPAVHFLKTTFRDADFYWIANTKWTPLLEENSDLKAVSRFSGVNFEARAASLSGDLASILPLPEIPLRW